MSEFTLHVVDREWRPIIMPAGVMLSPEQSWDGLAIGGPDSADVRLRGDAEAIAEIMHWLGYGLWIVAPDAEYVWWGEIEEIRSSHNGVVTGVTLNGMANRIKVLYTVFDPGGGVSAGETAWAENAESIALYGRRERRVSAEAAMRAPQAERMRDTLLGLVSRPFPIPGGLGSGNSTSVTLRCVGFWRRLQHVYYANDAGLVEHATGNVGYPLGLGFSSNVVAAVSRDARYSFHDVDGKFANFGLDGLQFKVAGMGDGANNSAFTVRSADGKEPYSITASNIKFDPADDIEETPYAYQLVEFGADDVILISGAYDAANNGSHLVKTPGAARIEISPGWSNAIVAAGAGFPIDIKRGNAVKVEEAVINERIGASATVRAYGQGIAQRFQAGTATAWEAASVELRVRKVGAPADNIEIRLVTDAGGAFGTWVATAILANGDIPGDEGGVWLSASFDIPYSLAPGTWYWLGIQRTGTPDYADYFEVWLDDNAGYGGTLLLSDGASWHVPATPKSLTFRVLGAVDTAEQVRAICDSVGVFTATTVLNQSGVKTNQYRDGTQFAAKEIEQLLNTGDSANTRLLASVGHQGNVTIRSTPAPSSAMHVWRGPDDLATVQGSKESLGMLPVGVWCHLNDTTLLQGALAEASPFLVERARYATGSGWELEPAGRPDPWAIGEARNG